MSDVDIRYKIYLCQMKLKDYKSAQKTVRGTYLLIK